MISVNEFYQRWNKEKYPLIRYEKETVLQFLLPASTKEFLINAGLPKSATPGLNFVSIEKSGLATLNQMAGMDLNKEGYIYLGFTGEGDFVCVIEKTGFVVRVDHEDIMRDQFINSSIPQLAECLLEYDDFKNQIKIANGKFAFVHRDAPIELLDKIIKKLTSIDENALNENSFWAGEISYFTDKNK